MLKFIICSIFISFFLIGCPSSKKKNVENNLKKNYIKKSYYWSIFFSKSNIKKQFKLNNHLKLLKILFQELNNSNLKKS